MRGCQRGSDEPGGRRPRIRRASCSPGRIRKYSLAANLAVDTVPQRRITLRKSQPLTCIVPRIGRAAHCKKARPEPSGGASWPARSGDPAHAAPRRATACRGDHVPLFFRIPFSPRRHRSRCPYTPSGPLTSISGPRLAKGQGFDPDPLIQSSAAALAYRTRLLDQVTQVAQREGGPNVRDAVAARGE